MELDDGCERFRESERETLRQRANAICFVDLIFMDDCPHCVLQVTRLGLWLSSGYPGVLVTTSTLMRRYSYVLNLTSLLEELSNKKTAVTVAYSVFMIQFSHFSCPCHMLHKHAMTNILLIALMCIG